MPGPSFLDIHGSAKIEKLKNLYENKGWNFLRISTKYDISPNTIYAYAKRNNWKIRTNAETRKVKFTKSKIKKYLNLYLRGVTLTEIARFDGNCSRTAISTLAKDLDWSKLTISVPIKTVMRKKKYGLYAKLVRSASDRNYRKYKTLLDSKNKRSRKYHLDHKLSIYDAFTKFSKPLPLDLVCHPANLELLKYNENASKYWKSSLNKGQLLQAIRCFEKTNGRLKLKYVNGTNTKF